MNKEINLPIILEQHLTEYLKDSLNVFDREIIHDAMYDAIEDCLTVLLRNDKIRQIDAENILKNITR